MGQIKNIKLHIVTDIKYTLVQQQQQQTLLLRDGQVKEPHRSQPKCESSPQWNQETSGSPRSTTSEEESVTSSGAEDMALLNDFVVGVSCCYCCWEICVCCNRWCFN